MFVPIEKKKKKKTKSTKQTTKTKNQETVGLNMTIPEVRSTAKRAFLAPLK